MTSCSLDVLARLSPAVPEALARRAATFSGQPVAAVPSASVVLLREAAAGLETYLLHRHARMAFAASMVVFPGGRVDPADHRDPDPVLACAVRETAEETGVRLDPAVLRPWAHWVTPACEPRRFDTRFFVAALPPGQRAADLSGETEHAEWRTPAGALAAAARAEIALMPPTLSILTELAEAGSLRAVLELAADRRVQTVLPEVVRAGAGGWVFRYPGTGAR